MMRIVIPLEVPSQNRTKIGAHWQIVAKRTKAVRSAWRIHAQVETMRQDIPKATGPRRMHLIAYRKRLITDKANLQGGAKAPVDGLTDAGLLVDDKDKLADITYEQRLRSHPSNPRPGQVCTVVIFSDIAPDTGKGTTP